MNLNNQTLSIILNAIDAAEILTLQSISVESGVIRAMSIDNTVLLCHNTDIPTFDFKALGISNVGIFSNRLDIAKMSSKYSVDVELDSSNSFARQVTFKTDTTKVTFRCCNPATIRAPKSGGDKTVSRITIFNHITQYLSKGKSAMGCENVTIVGDATGVRLILTDDNNDQMEVVVNAAIDTSDCELPSNTSFKYTYPLKLVTSVFKHNSGGVYYLTTRGMLKTSINGLTAYLLPISG